MKRCDKYRNWLTDAALGSLARGREPELLAHAAECDACRKAYAQAREANAFAEAIDRGVASLVSGEPSPHFNARLRARIAAEASVPPRVIWRAWAPITAVATAFAVILTVFVLRTHHAIPANPEVALNSPAPPATADRPQPNDSVESAVLPAAHHSAATAHHSARLPHASPAQPEVLVDPGELAAAIRFADAIRSGRVDGQKLVAAKQQVDAPLEIKPIEIAPLSTLDVDLPDARPGSSRP